MPKLQSGIEVCFDAINKLPAARCSCELSADNTDFRLYELLKNDSRSNDRTGENTSSVFAASYEGFGGGERDRTDDPLLAKQVLSQLSYTPECVGGSGWIRTNDPRLIKTVL